MELKAVVPPEPGADLGMLVRDVIVDNQMHCALVRGLAVDLVEEADELLIPVAAHALADDLAVEHVERGDQGGCPVPLIVERRQVCRQGSGHRRPLRQSARARAGAVGR